MSLEEEVHEHVHHAAGSIDKRIAGSMAIIAALIAIVTVFGQHLTSEELLLQQKSSDQWAFYQAKSIRRFISEATVDTMTQMRAGQPAIDKYVDEAKRYRKESEEVQKDAQDFQEESRLHGAQALRVHFGEVFLEIAIVLASLAILTKRNFLFILGLASSAVGAVIAASYWLIK
jgi:uncharacterized protein DUF4337